ncbi:MAG: DUF3667 domain-containing protein [Prevotellaceae bacterium]|jgi:hypothetical protein|nr:DUF3667 domain-containing protein [Prevotellaceae bacterium]
MTRSDIARTLQSTYYAVAASLHRMWRRIRCIYRTLHIRQIHGFPPPPLSEADTVVCRNCDHLYEGNYCPRCGQSRKTYRFTFKRGIQNVLGGLTNIGNGFGRTLLELLFRPGYMISDFLSGKRVHYFRPFQTLFVLAAIYILASQLLFPGGTKKPAAEPSDRQTVTELVRNDSLREARYKERGVANTLFERAVEASEKVKDKMRGNAFVVRVWSVLEHWAQGNKAVQMIFYIPILAVATRIAFRRRRHNRRFNTTEHIFVQTFIASQMLLFSILYLPFATGNEEEIMIYPLPWWLVSLLFWWDYHQLFQCTWLRSLWRTLLVSWYYVLLLILLAIVALALWFGVMWLVGVI